MKKDDAFSKAFGSRNCGLTSEGERSFFEMSEYLRVRISSERGGNWVGFVLMLNLVMLVSLFFAACRPISGLRLRGAFASKLCGFQGS